ncbi:MAG TPA: 4Fe-4S dicluster domain-containing protein [Syntrophorhabdaceae bacterium]|jgi:formate dehydrogenase iron-sulfur subunit
MTKPVYPDAVPARAVSYEKGLSGMIPDEAEVTAGVRVVPGRTYGFFVDTSLCIGCKACEVACKEWNGLPADNIGLRGTSFDNTGSLSAGTWRHVRFIEKMSDNGGSRPTMLAPFQSNWLMMSDVCKHCRRAACLEACPTGALFRTEYGSVVVQQDICNGCGYCVPSCPFGVIELNMHDGKAHKCTLCYDRLKAGLEPACAKTCPTNSIQFGEVGELIDRAHGRLERLHALGRDDAYLYGVPGAPGATGGIKGLHAFFLLLDSPEVYNLPRSPRLPSRRIAHSIFRGLATVAGIIVCTAMTIRASANERE